MIRGSITPCTLAALILWGGAAVAQVAPPNAGAASPQKAKPATKVSNSARKTPPAPKNNAANSSKYAPKGYGVGKQTTLSATVSQAPATPPANAGLTIPVTSVFPTPGMAANYAPQGVASEHRLGTIGQRRVTLETERAEPWDAILNLLRESGVNYVIGGEALGGRKITARFKDVSLEEALDALADAAGLNYTLRRGIIILTASEPVAWTNAGNYMSNGSPNVWSNGGNFNPNAGGIPAYTPLYPAPGGETGAPPVAPTPDGSGGAALLPSTSQDQVEVVGVVNRPVDEVMQLMPTNMAQLSTLTVMRADPRTNSLLLGGPPGAIQAAKDIVQVLDVPATAVPTVRVRFHIFTQAGSLPQVWFNDPATKSADTKPDTQPDTQVAVLRSAGDRLETLVKEVKDSGGVLSGSPVVLTFDKVRAEITLSPGNGPSQGRNRGSGRAVTALSDGNGFKFNLLPRLNADGTLTLTLSLLVADPSAASDSARAPALDPPKGADGNWKVISELERRIGQNDVLAVMKPSGNAEGGSGQGASLILVNAHVETNAPPPAPNSP